ncbi:M20/M25/M40 family metallo-hydrolase [Streptomyces sp. NPDC031705]|uniref:M20/M25/M40 family metallo-hydrolase n=1 Tax=Streptomyces sp. NPDC031705 TaxID=3155729 RepID=UPI0033E681A6
MNRGADALRMSLARYGPAAAACAAAAYAATSLTSPRPRPDSAPQEQFSAERAMRHVRAVAGEPHPVGSPAAALVRDYLLAELKDLGFETQVQEAVAGHDLGPTPYGPRYLTGGVVRNVIGRLPGSVPGHAVLLMTHYDSVSQGPGASDAGVPVAALLEALRALRAEGEQPVNDVLVVFTDGEEAGLLGARAFFDRHPLAKTVGVAFNFEARGTEGPVLMFEAGPGNGPMLEELARTGVPVFASSLFDAIYRRMPNATDFALVKEQGIPGLNFAHIGGFAAYHGPLDDIDHVDPSALQHQGELALALTRRLGSADLAELGGEDAVFFPLGRGHLVRVPGKAVVPLTVAAGLLCAGGLGHALRKGGLTGRRLGGTGALLAGRIAAGAAAGTVFTAAMGKLAPEFRRHGDFHGSGDIYAAVAGLACAAVLAGPGDRTAATARTAAAALPLAAASAALAAGLPGGSYLTTWPLAGAGAGLWLLGSERPAAPATGAGPVPSVRHAMGAAAAAAPAAALLVPLSRLLFKGLTPRLAGTAVVALQLCGELAAPALAELPRRARRATAAAGLLLAGGVAARRFLRRGKGAPPPETLSHLLDPERSQALWISSDESASERTRAFLGEQPAKGRLPEHFPGWERDFLYAPAPRLDLPAPEVTVLEDGAGEAGRRRLLLRLRSPRGARQLSLAVVGGAVRRWRVEDGAWSEPASAAPAEDDSWELWLHAVPDSGIRVELELPSSEATRLRVLDRIDGLPQKLAAAPGTDPTAGIPEHISPAAALDVDTWGNASLVVRTVHLPVQEGPA